MQALPGTALGGAASALQQDSREEQEEQQQQEEEDTEPRTARRASSSAFSLAAASTAFLCLQWVRIDASGFCAFFTSSRASWNSRSPISCRNRNGEGFLNLSCCVSFKYGKLSVTKTGSGQTQAKVHAKELFHP
jgi:hypothetical protein